MKKFMCILLTVLISLLTGKYNLHAESVDDVIVSKESSLEININAKSYILMDANTGTVLLKNNENEKLYPASVTKIMSLILVFSAIEAGKLSLDSKIICSESAAEKGGSQIWLEPGEEMTVDELIKAVVIYSANDACCLLGEAIAGSEQAFVSMMNETAIELGMKNTNFDNCTGLDDDTQTHKSTAYDIALMSKKLLEYDLVRNYTTVWMDTLRNGTTQLVNTNKLIRTYPGATGLKTGTTSKAGCCVSASASRDGLELIAVVLGADNSKERFSAAAALLDWGFANYEIVTLTSQDMVPDSLSVSHGTKSEVKLTCKDQIKVLIKKGTESDIKSQVIIEEYVNAPIEKNLSLGFVIFTYEGKEIGKLPIKTSESVDEMTIFYAIDFLFSSLKNENS